MQPNRMLTAMLAYCVWQCNAWPWKVREWGFSPGLAGKWAPGLIKAAPRGPEIDRTGNAEHEMLT